MTVKEMTVPSRIEFMDDVLQFVNTELDRSACPKMIKARIDIALDEVFTNIASYAYGSGEGDVTVRVEIKGEPPSAYVEFADRGIPYNPLERTDPNTKLPLEERQVGGLGILLVKDTMDVVEYRYDDGQNILGLRKSLV